MRFLVALCLALACLTFAPWPLLLVGMLYIATRPPRRRRR